MFTLVGKSIFMWLAFEQVKSLNFTIFLNQSNILCSTLSDKTPSKDYTLQRLDLNDHVILEPETQQTLLNIRSIYLPCRCSSHAQVLCFEKEKQEQACSFGNPVNVRQRHMVPQIMAMWVIHQHMAHLMEANLMIPQVHLQVSQPRMVRAGDDGTCMKLQTCTTQSACNEDMIFHPDKYRVSMRQHMVN